MKTGGSKSQSKFSELHLLTRRL